MAKQKPSDYTREKLAGAHYLLDKMTEKKSKPAISPFCIQFRGISMSISYYNVDNAKELHCYRDLTSGARSKEWMKKDPQMKLVLR